MVKVAKLWPTIGDDLYQVIYADPPWPCIGGFAPNASYASAYHYPTMKIQDIISLPIENLLDDCAVLFLWVPYRDLPVAINKVIPSWGFEYKTVGFNWVKLTNRGNPIKVMGYYFFNSTELCLFATRGKPSRIHAGLHIKVDTLVMEERVRHSQKPDKVRDCIIELFPNTKRLELFAREKHAGWDVWGNEVESDVLI